MSVLAALYALATVDSAFCGYRAAAGRDGLIFKGAYYARAMLRGALAGQLACALWGVLLGGLVALSPERSLLLAELTRAGSAMLRVYAPYAVLIALAFAIRLIPSVDVRSLTSILVFGPLTFLRPAVAVAGIVAAWLAAPRPSLLLAGAGVVATMLGLERLLGAHISKSCPR